MVRDFLVEDGKIQPYDFQTRRGPLVMTGGFQPDGKFSVEGSERIKGTMSLSGKATGNKMTGRWSFEVFARGQNIHCSGPFEFTRQ
jgi:hypothetical protein